MCAGLPALRVRCVALYAYRAKVAAGAGFAPALADSESAVLLLDDPAMAEG